MAAHAGPAASPAAGAGGSARYHHAPPVVGIVAIGAVESAWLVAKEVKDLVQRERPFGAGLDVRDDSVGLGYASGHSAVAFAM